jgi:hypothetical protein
LNKLGSSLRWNDGGGGGHTKSSCLADTRVGI